MDKGDRKHPAREEIFGALREVKILVECWKIEYNTFSPA